MVARTTTRSGDAVVLKRQAKLGPGQAPPVGIENARQARENILRKILVIEDCVKKITEENNIGDDLPVIMIDALPKSQREFNAWESTELSEAARRIHGPFRKNGNATLLKNDDLLVKLRDYLFVLRNSRETLPSKRKEISMASLHRNLSIERTLRQIAERELARSRSQLWRGKKEVDRLNAALISTLAKAREEIEGLTAQLEMVAAERAGLASALKKITGIKRASK